jgi:UbiD family decarboxylase
MPYADIREYLSVLEGRGLLKRVTRTVDPAWEPACLTRWLYQGVPESQRFGLVFESVAGFEVPLMVGVLGASPAVYAAALETAPECIGERWVEAMRHPQPPVTVTDAPCQEIVRAGQDADIGFLPIPVWTPGKDAAPYCDLPHHGARRQARCSESEPRPARYALRGKLVASGQASAHSLGARRGTGDPACSRCQCALWPR